MVTAACVSLLEHSAARISARRATDRYITPVVGEGVVVVSEEVRAGVTAHLNRSDRDGLIHRKKYWPYVNMPRARRLNFLAHWMRRAHVDQELRGGA